MTSTSAALRIAVVNDYEIVVRGVAALLAAHADRVEVVELDSRKPVVSDVDIVLYDTFGQVQADQLDRSTVAPEGSKVVVYSWNVDPQLVRQALDGGVAGYISKTVDAARLVQLLEAVHAGRRVTPEPPTSPDEPVTGDWPGREAGLSARESEIVALITQGLTNNEIAQRSYLSINTVKTYIRTAYRKMGVQRRSQAVLWGVAHGFEPDRVRTLLDG